MRGDGVPPRGQGSQRRGLLSGQGSRNPDPNANRSSSANRRPSPRDDDASANDPYNPYQPYQPRQSYPGGGRTLASGLSGGMSSARARVPGGTFSEVALPAAHHHLGVSIFHDGNIGHLWRGEFFSRLAEAVISAGVIMWLAALYRSPLVVAVAVFALAFPFVIAGPAAARFQSVKRPDLMLTWLGRIRIVLALGLVVMHYRTLLPIIFLLLFAISLLGRFSDALRVAAARACLAPGEPEHVVSDLHIGASVAAVLGPLLATLLYVLLGERILAVSIGAVAFFALSANSEMFLDALPERRRAFMLAVPDTLDDEEEDETETLKRPSPEERREHGLPAWYQQGPSRGREGWADLRAGLGLAGTGGGSTAAIWALGALALIGGGLASLEVFYVLYRLQLPEFYLGPLLAAEGGGLALGALLAGGFARSWRIALFGGMALAGVAMLGLAWFPLLPGPLLWMFVLGIANAVAASGASRVLTTGFSGVEQRALGAAEAWVTALGAAIGSLALALFYEEAFVLPGGKTFKLPFHTYPIEKLIELMGGALIAGAVIFAVLSFVLGKQRAPKASEAASLSPTRARLAAFQADKVQIGAAAAWDHPDEDEGGWGEAEDDAPDDRYAASGAYDDGYDNTGYDNTGYDNTGYGPARRDRYVPDEDDYDDPPRGSRGGSSSRNPRPRW